MLKKYIGDRAFYRRVLAITVPIMVQMGISNFVSLLDNIMVGRIGTEQMSGVAIVNQLLFVFYLCIFGGFAGAGIFTAQYYGCGDHEGIRQTMRYKLWLGAILFAGALVVFLGYGPQLIDLYLNGSNDGGDLAATLGYAQKYLYISLAGLPAFAMVQVYANTLRECGETVVPMKAGLTAVFVNLAFNYLLIYGKFGFPELGVQGAAIATVIARFVEMTIVVSWAHTHKEKCPYIQGLYRTMHLPARLIRKYFITGSPLLVNEALWSLGMAFLTQSYSVRGLNVVAGQNISSTIANVFNVAFFAMGDAVAIIVGQLLGAGQYEKAKDEDRKIITFSVLVATGVGAVIFLTAPLFPRLYNTTPEAKTIAMHFLMVQAIFTPQNALLHTSYFTIRSGGRTFITFLFDSAFMWAVSVPLAYVLSRYTDLYVIWIFAILSLSELIKCVIGVVMVKKGIWIKNIVKDEEA
ncbi:MAG: MATE family efflux transporter [Lachnospiraceae bacterium]|nr:MATE family efflux transporter [Lachnospiraceae bacterium]